MHAMMDLAVTVRTDRTYEPGIVWASITEAAGMMGFEVGLALRGDEGCRLPAALANPGRSSENVAPDHC